MRSISPKQLHCAVLANVTHIWKRISPNEAGSIHGKGFPQTKQGAYKDKDYLKRSREHTRIKITSNEIGSIQG